MGRPKLLLPWHGTTLIEHVLGVWRSSRVTAVLVVTHPEDVELREAVRRAKAEPIVPSEPPLDMRASLVVGLRHVAKRLAPQPEDLWLTAPADHPFLTAELIDALLDTSASCPAPVVVPVCEGRRGHPVVLRWPLAAELEALEPGEGLHTLLRQHTVQPLAWNDPQIHVDLDTPDDYRSWGPRA